MDANERADVAAVMGTDAGRRLLWRWMSEFGLYESVLAKTNGDHGAVMLLACRREIALQIHAEALEASHGLYQKMQFEAMERKFLKEKKNG